jgi:hypothetical protein
VNDFKVEEYEALRRWADLACKAEREDDASGSPEIVRRSRQDAPRCIAGGRRGAERRIGALATVCRGTATMVGRRVAM